MDSEGSLKSQSLAKTRLNGMAVLLIIISIVQALEPSPPLQSLVSHELGMIWIRHMENAPSQVWQDIFRMRKECFNLLCTWLTQNTTILQSSTKIPVRESHDVFVRGMPGSIATNNGPSLRSGGSNCATVSTILIY